MYFHNLADNFNKCFRLEHSKLTQAMFDVLVPGNGLGVVSEYDGTTVLCHPQDQKKSPKNRKHPTTTRAAMHFVLSHITYRTLPFQKFFEFIRHDDIVSGLPNLAIPAAPVSPYHIKFALSYMSPPHSQYLVKVRLKGIVTPLYGLNWPGIMMLVADDWFGNISERTANSDFKAPALSNLCLTGLSKAILCASYLSDCISAFEHLIKLNSQVDREDQHFFKQLSKRAKKLKIDMDFDEELKECNKPGKLRQEWDMCRERSEEFRGFRVPV